MTPVALKSPCAKIIMYAQIIASGNTQINPIPESGVSWSSCCNSTFAKFSFNRAMCSKLRCLRFSLDNDFICSALPETSLPCTFTASLSLLCCKLRLKSKLSPWSLCALDEVEAASCSVEVFKASVSVHMRSKPRHMSTRVLWRNIGRRLCCEASGSNDRSSEPG